MSKRTRVSDLAGRVIESVTIYHSDGEDPVSVEIRCVGGVCFDFELISVVEGRGHACLYKNVNGEMRDEHRRSFTATGTVPYCVSDEELTMKDVIGKVDSTLLEEEVGG